MGRGRYFTGTVRVLTIAMITIATRTGTCAASPEQVLYAFQGGSDGEFPTAGLVADAQGNLYGTTTGGGAFAGGTVFKLTHEQDGSWSESVIHSFGDGNDGANPAASLIFDKSGNLYGTTTAGGANPPISDGTAFELSPTSSGEWTETILHSFNCTEGPGDNDGCQPYSYLVFDKDGDLYGTTLEGGGGDFTTFCQNGCGTVFELSPSQNGTWTEKLIHTFPNGEGGTADGQNPYAGLTFDNEGNLYGTTWIGGPDDAGTVFRLTPSANGQWKENVWSFKSTVNDPPDGANPYASVIFDKSGHLFGTTRDGGGQVGGYGTVFELALTSQGQVQETVVHAFPTPRYVDGELPLTAVTMDAAGNLYGATSVGGGEQEPDCFDFDGCGVVYKLSPNSDGSWTETVMYQFSGGSDGSEPSLDRVLVDSAGNVYGTTSIGGIGGGVVFKVTP